MYKSLAVMLLAIVTLAIVADSGETAVFIRRRSAGIGSGQTRHSASMHGTAHIIRNKGRAARAKSEARINNEEARSKYVDNQKKWTQTYFEKKAINAKYTSAKAAHDRAVTQNYVANRQSQAPARLSLSQYDSTTGSIHWPDVLLVPEFQPQREKLNQLFLLRSKAVVTSSIAAEIRTAVTDMRTELRKRIDRMTGNEYAAARKFLDSLAFEANAGVG